MKVIVSFIFLMVLATQAYAFEWHDSAVVEKVFNDAGIEDTFTLNIEGYEFSDG